MGNSQSYDVTNVHHRNSDHGDETSGTVKKLGDDVSLKMNAGEREKQENNSPRPSSNHKEFSAKKQQQEESDNITDIPKESTVCGKKNDTVSDVTHGISEIALENLHRVMPLETVPLDAKPTQCSYD